MKGRNPRDLSASVHQRLLNRARQTNRPFNELLQHYAIERFLYRLAQSRHSSKFVLKGALMLLVWRVPITRPTMDIDLLGRTRRDPEEVVSWVKEICCSEVEPDGLSFDTSSVRAEPIAEDADYAGMRIRFRATLGKARVAMQLDIGFGDVVVPSAPLFDFPTMLDFPAPRLRGYSKESAIAEKFEAMVRLGILNSRMKDFFDVWTLSCQFDFAGERLQKAISRTFINRGTPIPESTQILLSEIVGDEAKTVQWNAFLRKNRMTEIPGFEEIAEKIADFLHPIAAAIMSRQQFTAIWKAPGPWRHEP